MAEHAHSIMFIGEDVDPVRFTHEHPPAKFSLTPSYRHRHRYLTVDTSTPFPPVRQRPGRASQPASARHAGDLAGYLREREGDDTVEV